MLNRTGASLMTVAAVLLAAGLPNGNLFVSSLALIPMLVLAFGQATPRIRGSGRLDVPQRALRVGEVVEIKLAYSVRGGHGNMMIHQPLPDEFELCAGNNITLRRKGLGPRAGALHFSVRCHRRGHFMLPPARLELVPSLHLSGTVSLDLATTATLDFRPDLTRFRRLPGGRMLAKEFMPQDDRASVGMRTAEFRDLRDYQRGDPPKTINWSATARRASAQAPGQAILPLINDYEAEGQRNVWIFLDCGPAMAVGSNVQNAFEAGVQGAGSIAQFFLDRGFRVGFSLYNTVEALHLYPDTGRRQMGRIETALHGAEPSAMRGQLGHASQRVKGFLRGGATWVVVVSRVESMDDADLQDLRRLRNATAARRTGTHLMVISPDPYGMLPLEPTVLGPTRALQRALDAPRLEAVRRMGVRLIHWDPSQRPLHAHLIGARR